MHGKNHQQTVIVKYQGSGRRERHVIELLPYHVSGWASTRCLTHGTQQPGMLNGTSAADLTQASKSAAVSCGRLLKLPFAHTVTRELAPLLHLADGEWTRIEQGQEA